MRSVYSLCIRPLEKQVMGDRLMLCLNQHNRGMPEEISTRTSESHVFETDFWCVFPGIEESEDRQRKKSVITKVETIFYQKGDQYLEELVVSELANKDKEKLSKLRKYDAELQIMEDWLINPRIDKDDYLILGYSVGKEQIEGQNIEMYCEPVYRNRELKEPKQF